MVRLGSEWVSVVQVLMNVSVLEVLCSKCIVCLAAFSFAGMIAAMWTGLTCENGSATLENKQKKR